MVTDSSAESFDNRTKDGTLPDKKARILKYLENKKCYVTRLMIATALEIPTATVSGIIKPLIAEGELEQGEDKSPCPVSPHHSNVYWVRFPMPEPVQKRLI